MSNNVNRKTTLGASMDSLQGIPGETFLPEASWQKMEQRLYKHPAKKYRLLLWLAAACILAMLAVLPFIRKEVPAHHHELVAVPVTTPVTLPATTQQQVQDVADTKTSLGPAPLMNNAVLPTANPHQGKQGLPVQQQRAQDSVQPIPVAPGNMVQYTPTPLPVPDSLEIKNTVAQTTPPKRIVHINDLMDPVMDEQSAARKEQSKLLRFLQRKNIHREASAVTETPSANHTIIKHIN